MICLRLMVAAVCSGRTTKMTNILEFVCF